MCWYVNFTFYKEEVVKYSNSSGHAILDYKLDSSFAESGQAYSVVLIECR